MVKLDWLAQAEFDLLEIWEFIAQDSPDRATQYIKKIEAKAEQLKGHPQSGVRRKDISREAYHLVFENYLILYKIKGDLIEIIRCVHGSRKLSDLSL